MANPNGRPPRGRALTEILAQRGDTEVVYLDQAMPAKNAVAAMTWDLLTKGQIIVGGRTLKIETGTEWLLAARWLYGHVDGAAPKEKMHSGEVILRVERKAAGERE